MAFSGAQAARSLRSALLASRSLRSSGKYAVGYVVYGLMFMAVGVFLGVLVISTTSFKPGWSGCGVRKNCVEIYQTSAKSDYSRLVQVSPKPGFLAPEGGS